MSQSKEQRRKVDGGNRKCTDNWTDKHAHLKNAEGNPNVPDVLRHLFFFNRELKNTDGYKCQEFLNQKLVMFASFICT